MFTYVLLGVVYKNILVQFTPIPYEVRFLGIRRPFLTYGTIVFSTSIRMLN